MASSARGAFKRGEFVKAFPGRNFDRRSQYQGVAHQPTCGRARAVLKSAPGSDWCIPCRFAYSVRYQGIKWAHSLS
jgi:hypothetical protein